MTSTTTPSRRSGSREAPIAGATLFRVPGSDSGKQLEVETDTRTTTVDVTDRVREAVPDDCESGLCTVFVEHTTAAVVVQESEPRLRGDIETFLGNVVPDDGHAHDELDDNSVERCSTSFAA